MKETRKIKKQIEKSEKEFLKNMTAKKQLFIEAASKVSFQGLDKARNSLRKLSDRLWKWEQEDEKVNYKGNIKTRVITKESTPDFTQIDYEYPEIDEEYPELDMTIYEDIIDEEPNVFHFANREEFLKMSKEVKDDLNNIKKIMSSYKSFIGKSPRPCYDVNSTLDVLTKLRKDLEGLREIDTPNKR